MPDTLKPQTPPEDAPWTIDELIRKRASTDPTFRLVAYPSETGEYVDYTARQLDYYAYCLACDYAPTIQPRSWSHERPKVVGLLGSSNLSYLLSALALSKLGMTVLFLSTRLPDVAYKSLLEATSCNDLVVDDGLKSKIANLSNDMPQLNVHRLEQFEKYQSAEIEDDIDTAMDKQLDKLVENTHNAWIIHSSGSTGIPKVRENLRLM